jgi:hypothetical protein
VILSVVLATPLALVVAVVLCEPIMKVMVSLGTPVEPSRRVAVSVATSLYCLVESPL